MPFSISFKLFIYTYLFSTKSASQSEHPQELFPSIFFLLDLFFKYQQQKTNTVSNTMCLGKGVTGLGGLFSFQSWQSMYRHGNHMWAGLTLCHRWWHLRESSKENLTGWLRHKGFPVMDVFGSSGVPNFVCLQVCNQRALRSGKHHSGRDKASRCDCHLVNINRLIMSSLLLSGVHMSSPRGTVFPLGKKYKQESRPLVTLSVPRGSEAKWQTVREWITTRKNSKGFDMRSFQGIWLSNC